MTRKPKRKAPPHWLTARFGGGVCSGEGCNEVIRKGDKVFYFPGTRAILATRCGHAHAAVRRIEAVKMNKERYGDVR
jgi:hypothetical protein